MHLLKKIVKGPSNVVFKSILAGFRVQQCNNMLI